FYATPKHQSMIYLVSLHDALPISGIIVIGYVATGYASKLISSLESQISSYKNWYSVNGIFFDEMSSVQGNEGYYSTLNTYVKSLDRKSTRLNCSHVVISYDVFCLK